MKKIFLIIVLLTGFLYPQTEVFIVRNKIDTLRIDVNDLKSGLGGTLMPPSDLIAVGDTNRFFLTWSDNSSNEEGFRLSVSSNGSDWGTPWTVPANSTSFTYAITGDSITRYFKISAYLGGLETSQIISGAATTLDFRDHTPPYIPYNVVATGGLGNIVITWDDSTSVNNVAGYAIYRSVTEVPVGLTPLTTISAKNYEVTGGYTDTGLGYGETYYYRIKGYDAAGNYSDYSLSDSGITNQQIIADTASNSYIWSALFENGDMSEFTSVTATPNEFGASTLWSNSGSYSGRLYFNGANTANARKDFTTLPDTFYTSFRINFDTLDVNSSAKSLMIYELRTGTVYHFRFGFRTNATGEINQYMVYYNDSTGANNYSSATGFSVGEHLIEIRYNKHISAGGAMIWIDSVYNATLSKQDRNTSGEVTENIRFGSVYVTGGTMVTGRSIYFDDIFVDTTRIGITGGTIVVGDVTPPNTPTNFVATGKYDVSATPNLSYVDLSWTDASSDEAKFYIYKGSKDALGGSLALFDSVNANVTSWRDNTIPLTDTLHYYEYGLTARDVSYNYTPIVKDSAYLPGKPTVTAGTAEGDAYFVSPYGNGGDGKSWANAWTLLSDSSASSPNGINWNIIQPGDTIYVDGGASGISYTETLSPKKSGTLNNYVVIIRGTSTGRNGEPYLAATVNPSNANYWELNGFSMRKIEHNVGATTTFHGHWRFKNLIWRNTTNLALRLLNGARYIEIIDCEFQQAPVTSGENDCVFIRSNWDSNPAVYPMADSIFVIGCTFQLETNAANSAHTDGLQTNFAQNIWYEGNKVYFMTDKTNYAQALYLSQNRGKVYVLNNIFYIDAPVCQTPMIAVHRQGATSGSSTYSTVDSAYFVDNTVINKSSVGGKAPYFESITEGVQIKNNFMAYVGASAVYTFGSTNPNSTANITADYNYYYRPTGSTSTFTSSYSSSSYSGWTGGGKDANGTYVTTPQPSFVSFDWAFTRPWNISTIRAYDLNLVTPPNGTAFTVSFGNRTYTSDGKIGALIP